MVAHGHGCLVTLIPDEPTAIDAIISKTTKRRSETIGALSWVSFVLRVFIAVEDQ